MRCAFVLPLLLTACGSLSPGAVPDRVVGLPWGDGAADRVALAARQLVERGETAAALQRIETVLERQPRHVDALRLRQDLLRSRGRRGLLLHEARAALAARPDGGIEHYLYGRIVDEPAEKLAAFRAAAAAAPDQVWPWLGLAHTLRSVDHDRALEIYERLYAASDGHPLVGVAFAAALREHGRLAAAAAVYAQLRDDERVPGVGDLGLAQVALAKDERGPAWTALLEALRQRPYDPGVQALLHGWLEATISSDQAAQVVDVLREDPERFRAFGDGPGAIVLAELLQRHGQTFAARDVLERRLGRTASPAVRRAMRRLLLATGDLQGFVARLAADVPFEVVAVEANRVRGRWLTLLRGPWSGNGTLAGADEASALLTALRDVGWLVEVELLADLLAVRFPAGAAAFAALRDEARRELAFEAGLRRLLYQGYTTRDAADLGAIVQRLRELSVRVLGRDVVGRPERFSIPLVGEMLDPFRGGLAEHLDRYNRHLVLGRRAGGTAEGMLVTRLSVVELPAAERQELPAPCIEVVGVDRDVRALAGVLGGDLAGVALLNHFLVDYDAVREWAATILERRQVARADGLALLDDPLPEVGPRDPLDVAFRLSVRSPVADEDLEAAVLDMIRAHERRHLVDSFRYLPIETNLWRGVGLLFEFGFSPAAIEAEMERRAELAALAVSPHTELVLAHIADFLAAPGVESPHHLGFGELAADLGAALVALGVPAADAVPSRWHLVDPALHRQAASRLLDTLPRP